MGTTPKDKDRDADVSGSVATASDERKERRGKSSKSDLKFKGDKEKTRDKEREKDRDRDGHRIHKSKTSRTGSRLSSMLDGETELSSRSHRRHRTKEEKERDRDRDREKKKRSSMGDIIPEMSRDPDSRVSLPYPNFSKAHSREDVHSKEDVSTKKADPLTPEATDMASAEMRRSKSDGANRDAESRRSGRPNQEGDDRPPSPPDTEISGEKRRTHTSAPHLREEFDRPRSRTSGTSRSSSKHDGKSKVSTKSKTSQATFVKSPVAKDNDSYVSDEKTAGARSASGTSVPRRTGSGHKTSRIAEPQDADDSPDSVQDSSPKTPTATAQFPSPHVLPEEKLKPSASPHPHIMYDDTGRPSPAATPMTDFGPAPPPPPPPPRLNIHEVPRIDYLLQNGGLPYPVPKNFLSVLPQQNGSRPSNPPLIGAETLFAPFFNLLDQYQSVLHKQGSVAVATGHKSVARRLLDRLEDVFSRDLPLEGCGCVMCEKTPGEHRGLGWGEVLERVGGRVELPPWPPFDLASVSVNAAEEAGDIPPRPASPVKLDPDIAEEFREHYLRQSKKVRSAVDKWLNVCAEAPAPPPQDVDDETLAFAILTSLDEEERPYFNALSSGSRELQPAVRAPTPNVRKPRVDFVVKMGLSLQRLYRLNQVPRDAETVVYLVKNPFHHDLLHTIADISPQEWEILTSGRFDGFLWSGADADDGITPTAENPGLSSPPSRASLASRPAPGGRSVSRNTTPFSGVYSRGTTPASFVSIPPSTPGGFSQNRHAVSHDEETEIAALNEVEREIYQGMEALEDAFQKLHEHAETVRNALRQRNAGLMLSMQNRRAGSRIDVLPQSGNSQGYERPEWAAGDEETSESDWGGDDIEIAPDDSASNISSSRHRRPKRRTERRTPAPIEEDEEEV